MIVLCKTRHESDVIYGVKKGNMESDLDYFEHRASEERSAALQASHAEAQSSHTVMADRYDDLVRGIAASHEQMGIAQRG